jgi:hypothetical protein
MYAEKLAALRKEHEEEQKALAAEYGYISEICFRSHHERTAIVPRTHTTFKAISIKATGAASMLDGDDVEFALNKMTTIYWMAAKAIEGLQATLKIEEAEEKEKRTRASISDDIVLSVAGCEWVS